MGIARRVLNVVIANKSAIIVLLFAIILHFWYIIVHPSVVLYGGPGDHTAGLIWLYDHSPNNPWWTYTNSAAFPFGDKLWNATYILGQSFYVMYWLCAAAAHNGVAGYNLLMIFAFSWSYIVFYICTKRLLRIRPHVIALAAYIAVFSPFLLFLNSVGQLSYAFAPGVVSLLFYSLSKLLLLTDKTNKTKLHIVIVVIILGLSWLHDPYFVLFLWILFVGFILGVLAYRSLLGIENVISLRKLLSRVGIVSSLSILCFVPLLMYSVQQSDSLKKETMSVRSDIKIDATLYSTRIKDYLLPSAANPFLPKGLEDLKKNTYHGTNPTFTTYIGWSTLLIIFVAVATWLKRRRNKNTLSTKHSVVFVASVVVLVLFIFSLPPKLQVFGLIISTPTDALTSLVGVWRVLARAYTFLFPIYMVVVAVCLDYLISASNKKMVRYALYTLVVFMCFEFLARNPLDSRLYWGVESSVPSTYATVKSSPDIKVLAEYPLREAPHYRASLYFTSQLYHQKTLFNSTQAVTGQTLLREALMDLENPQTIRALRLLGVDAIQVWNNYTQQWKGSALVREIDEAKYSSMFGKDEVVLYKIIDEQSLDAARYVAHLDVDSRMTNGEYIYAVKQTIPAQFNIGVYDICAMTKIANCGGHNKTRFLMHAAFVNDANISKTLTVDNHESSVAYELLPHSTTQVIAIMDTQKYGGVNIKLSNSDGVSVYDYYVDTGVKELDK